MQWYTGRSSKQNLRAIVAYHWVIQIYDLKGRPTVQALLWATLWSFFLISLQCNACESVKNHLFLSDFKKYTLIVLLWNKTVIFFFWSRSLSFWGVVKPQSKNNNVLFQTSNPKPYCLCVFISAEYVSWNTQNTQTDTHPFMSVTPSLLSYSLIWSLKSDL